MERGAAEHSVMMGWDGKCELGRDSEVMIGGRSNKGAGHRFGGVYLGFGLPIVGFLVTKVVPCSDYWQMLRFSCTRTRNI